MVNRAALPACELACSAGKLEVLKKIASLEVDSNLTCISALASFACHRPMVSATLLPSEKLASSVAIGYQVTYPIPRTAVNDLLIWSQSLCLAFPSGTSMRVRRVVAI